VADAIQAELAYIAGRPLGATGEVVRSLHEIMEARAMSPREALRAPELTAGEILNS
jgi:hypothetical protein